jgi:hypothetical protein
MPAGFLQGGTPLAISGAQFIQLAVAVDLNDVNDLAQGLDGRAHHRKRFQI